MKTSIITSICLLFLLLLRAQGEKGNFKIPDNAASELPMGVPRIVDTNGKVLFIDSRFTTEAYYQEGLKLVIGEANKVAVDLSLPESLPITTSNLTHAFIGSFGFNYQFGGVGNITTTNYWYFVKGNNKLSDVTIANIDGHCREYSEKYQWSVRRLDTNAAFQLATQWLAATKMDVETLCRDCVIHIDVDPFWNNVRLGQLPKKKFVPIYYIWWNPMGGESDLGGASVELFLPTKTLLSLSVDDPKYILRAPVVFTNLAALFPGKATITTNDMSKARHLVWPGH